MLSNSNVDILPLATFLIRFDVKLRCVRFSLLDPTVAGNNYSDHLFKSAVTYLQTFVARSPNIPNTILRQCVTVNQYT